MGQGDDQDIANGSADGPAQFTGNRGPHSNLEVSQRLGQAV